jgi:hypothetical protein
MTDHVDTPATPEVEGNPGSQETNTENVEQSPAEKGEPSFSKQFSALSRKEKAIRRREAELKAKEQEYKAWQEAQSSQKQEPSEPGIEDLLKTQPLKALEKAGYKLDHILEIIANDGQIPNEIAQSQKEQALEAKIAQLEDMLNSKFDDLEKSNLEKQHNQVVNNFKQEIKDFVDSNAEDFEFIKFNDGYDEVFNLVDAYYKKNGQILDIKQAAELVEQYYEGEAQKLTQVSKLRKAFVPSQEPSQKENVEDPQDLIDILPDPSEFLKDQGLSDEPESFTLQNEHAGSTPTEDPTKGMSEEERLRYLASKFL